MIEFNEAGFTYDGSHFVLDDVTLSVPKGQFLCILGSNGSGKSTLAKHINALLTPDRGTVSVMGNDTSNPEALFLVSSNAGMVFQNPDDQLVATIVENDVAFGPENLGLPADELRKRVTEALATVGLQGYEARETNALSGGQKQRVAIAGVLAMRPQILILDEASAMIDPRGRAGLIRVVKELHEAGLTIIMVTHFMEEAALADRVILMKEGHIVADGEPADILTNAQLMTSMNLEVPFTTQLAADLQNAGVPVTSNLSETDLQEELCNLFSAM